MTPEDITSTHDFDEGIHAPAQRIKVIGVGGGGNNAVNHMFNQGIKDVSFVLINTDQQALDQSAIPTRIVIGPGRGAGGKPERAKEFAESNADKIADLFDDDTDMVFITAGMGGGTGTGAAPVVARIAKDLGILTVGIVTIPFFFEGKRKVLKALEGAKEMSKNVDALLMINNERLTEIYKDLDIFNAFAKADDTLLTAAQGITEIITIPGVVNRDFNDVDSTLREGGTAIISSGFGEGENRVTKAIEDALHSPLLRNTDIFGSKKLLMVLYVSDDQQYPFEMSEANQLTDFVNNIDSDVEVMWGLYRIPGLESKVKITILASGFDVTVDDNGSRTIVDPAKIERDAKEKEIIANEYGSAAADTLGTRPAGSRAKVLQPNELDNDDAIADAERVAYTRNRRNVSSSGSFNSSLRSSLNNNREQRAPSTQQQQSGGISFDDLLDS
jgi:cell division protein FtsZ